MLAPIGKQRIRLRVNPSLLPQNIELQEDDNLVQWRYVGQGDDAWQTLFEIDDITATVTVGTVSTLAPGETATVTNVGTNREVILDFGIPAGSDGLVQTLVEDDGSTVDATDPNHPIVATDKSTQSEAEVGTNTAKTMTPIRVAQAIDRRVAVFNDKASAEAATPDTVSDVVTTRGYNSAGDGGGADYANPVTVDPSASDSITQMVGTPAVQYWLRRVHEDDALSLDRHGAAGDAYTNALSDDTTVFLDAMALASDLGISRVCGRAGKQYRITDAAIVGDTHVPVDGTIEIDGRGGVLVGTISGSNGSERMLGTTEADNISAIIRNITFDGTYTTNGVSGQGDRVVFFDGGDLIAFEDVVFKGMSNRQANAAAPIDIFDYAEYKKGAIVVRNAKRAMLNRTRMTSVMDEAIIVMSDDGSTVLTGVDNIWDKKRISDGTTMSGTPLNVFNVNPSSILRNTKITDCSSSALNLMTNGMTLDGFYISGVSSSSCVDFSEASAVAFSQFVARNGYVAGFADAGIRAAAKSIIIENIDLDIPSGKNGILIEGVAAGVTWDGSWFPAAGSYALPGVRIRQIRAAGAGSSAAIMLEGASSTLPIRAEIDNVQYRGSGGQPDYAVDASNAIVTAKGYWDAGDSAVVRLADFGHFLGDSWVVDPDATVITLNNMPSGTQVHLKDSRRVGSLAGGAYDVGRGGTTTAAMVKVYLEGVIDSSFDSATLDGSIAVLKQGAYRATQTYNPNSLAPGARTATQTVTVTGAALGDSVTAGFSNDLQGAKIVAWVDAANSVKYYFENATPATNLNGSATYNPPSLAPGERTATQTMTVTGAALGDAVDAVSFSNDLQGAKIIAWVSAADTVSYYVEAPGPATVLTGSVAFNPASAADGAGETSTTITVTGAALGDLVTVSFSLDLQGILLTGYVSAANTVTCRFQNETGGPIDLTSGTLRARVLSQGSALDLASGTVRVRVTSQGSNLDLASGTVSVAVRPAV